MILDRNSLIKQVQIKCKSHKNMFRREGVLKIKIPQSFVHKYFSDRGKKKNQNKFKKIKKKSNMSKKNIFKKKKI